MATGRRQGLGLARVVLVLLAVSALVGVALGIRRGGDASLDHRSHRQRHSGTCLFFVVGLKVVYCAKICQVVRNDL